MTLDDSVFSREFTISDVRPRGRGRNCTTSMQSKYPYNLTTDSIQYLWPQSPWFLHDKEKVDRNSQQDDREGHKRGDRLEEERQEDKERKYHHHEASNRKDEPCLWGQERKRDQSEAKGQYQ